MQKETRKSLEFWLSVARTVFALIAASASIVTATFILSQHIHR